MFMPSHKVNPISALFCHLVVRTETGLVCNAKWMCPVIVGAVEERISECNVIVMMLHSWQLFERCWLVIRAV